MDWKSRVGQKIAELDDRISFLSEHVSGESPFFESRVLRKAVYKEFQELAEAISDILGMALKASGKIVEDDYSNIERGSKLIGVAEIASDLKKINGLRNVLVHEYNGIVEKRAFESITSLLPAAEAFSEGTKKWLKK